MKIYFILILIFVIFDENNPDLHTASYNSTWEVVVDNHHAFCDVMARLQSVQRVVKSSVRRIP